MQINLNDPEDFTIENIKTLVASEDDTVNTQFRVTEDGILLLSRVTGNRNLDGIKFCLETNARGNGYVGKTAAQDDVWVRRVYKAIKDNWPDPVVPYIDNF
ncbi:hypothetical protein JMN32_22300 [Fulvivirga sp. 29W222]|uniref:Uncharacterized protein n=1 Tax=Fulvivirga marina TaxID=2494733 RepID=A0A937KG64_9BACT|nr:hypothetical protein [Fulvivirga marina]MBL6449060.1 hypothetical protein [Fulvivirga marina]